MTTGTAWQRLDLKVRIEPPLEVRAQPSAGGGWTIRAERSLAPGGTVLFGYLQASPQDYAVRVG